MIAGLLEAEPANSFPRAMGSDAALEAFYRFINNNGYGAADIVAPHIASATVETRTAMADVAVRNVIAVLSGDPPLTPVT